MQAALDPATYSPDLDALLAMLIPAGIDIKKLMSIANVFDMVEVPFSSSFISPGGEPIEINGLARTGPYIFGHTSTALILPSRASKPQYYDSPTFTETEMRHLLREISRDSHLLENIRRSTSSLDSLLQQIVQQRAEYERKRCVFCPENLEQMTPTPRIYHQGLTTESGAQVVSFPNIRSFMPGHTLTVFADHQTDIGNLSYRDITNYFRSGRELAYRFRAEGANGIVDFMNWGPDAAASVRHPHAQRGQLIRGMESHYRQMQQSRYFHSVDGDTSRLMENAMDIIRSKYPQLHVFENDHILVFTPFAPIHPDQTEVIFKRASNILDFTESDLEIASRSMLGVIHGLRTYRGVTDINLVLHQSDFNNGNNGFRMRAVISPRNKNKHGGLEVGQGVYVVDTPPEATAEALRRHYHS